MVWQDFFKFTVHKAVRGKNEIFFEAHLPTPQNFAMHELLISRFDYLKLNSIEKKKLSLDQRKLIVSLHHLKTPEFKTVVQSFKRKLLNSEEKQFTFSVSGGGIYLFLALLGDKALKEKTIICYTSELPLPVFDLPMNPQMQFIYRPGRESYLSDFSTLWKESEVLKLFELKDFKASA